MDEETRITFVGSSRDYATRTEQLFVLRTDFYSKERLLRCSWRWEKVDLLRQHNRTAYICTSIRSDTAFIISEVSWEAPSHVLGDARLWFTVGSILRISNENKEQD